MGTETQFERRLRSCSAEATERLGAAIGQAASAGMVIALSGDLGAGKTCFVRGLARGLEVVDPVSSPTYTLMHAYEGRLPLYHFDAWMEGREKALFLDGGDDWLHAGGVAVIEWAERVADWLPEPRLEIELTHLGQSERGLRLRVHPGGLAGGMLGELVAGLELSEGLLEQANPGSIPREKGEPEAG
ncbi:MAG: tRNA threonylcarbamoyladenosine biosynthesis protein TsaE [Chlamydiales bacterium]|jgi:tRNA threonylcarbamoyladenosine biosynthesis protein TsaE